MWGNAVAVPRLKHPLLEGFVVLLAAFPYSSVSQSAPIVERGSDLFETVLALPRAPCSISMTQALSRRSRFTDRVSTRISNRCWSGQRELL